MTRKQTLKKLLIEKLRDIADNLEANKKDLGGAVTLEGTRLRIKRDYTSYSDTSKTFMKLSTDICEM